MDYTAFLTTVIDQGIAAASDSYKKSPSKLAGAIDGFNACRGKLAALLSEARKATAAAYHDKGSDYWHIRCYEAEIEWTCNVVSAMIMNQGLAVIIPPTARGVMKATTIIGVAASD
jgi:hypothetical protein